MKRIVVGTATCGVAAGAGKVVERLRSLAQQGADIEVLETGCLGLCYAEPLVEVFDESGASRLYGRITPELAEQMVHPGQPDSLQANLLRSNQGTDADGVLSHQVRTALVRCGHIQPTSLGDFLATQGYVGLRKALALSPQEVIQTVLDSGLRGRGGGGFPTGRKWSLAAQEADPVKYVICNADEGDPGAFMDRSLLEGDPFAIIEGMTICAYAIGSQTGYIYCRAEYPKALDRVRRAILQAREAGYLGNAIMGSSFHFDIKVKEGAGAFVCGEETALMASIEGRRGMPRFRPPYPAQRGLFGKPTNINNVETYANVPWVFVNGPAAFAAYGTPDSKGTKVFALAGKIRRGGLVEVPMGMTIRQLVMEVGGGVGEGHTFKAVQMGGPSGGCIPESLADIPIDYKSIQSTGAIIGSGGVVVMDDSTCMVDVARYFLTFTQSESCGKCTFCRIGTKRMLEILERITAGHGQEGDVERLLDLGRQISESSLCGLGQTAPNPVVTTIRHFRAEYDAHIREHRCPAHSCSALVSYSINPTACTGCTACARACPVHAIAGAPRAIHSIDRSLCVRCGKCSTVCSFDAVIKE